MLFKKYNKLQDEINELKAQYNSLNKALLVLRKEADKVSEELSYCKYRLEFLIKYPEGYHFIISEDRMFSNTKFINFKWMYQDVIYDKTICNFDLDTNIITCAVEKEENPPVYDMFVTI